MIRGRSNSSSLRKTLQHGVFGAGVSLLIVTVAITLWTTYRTRNEEQRLHASELTAVVGELVRRSVAVSDFGETQRLLGLVATRDNLIAAVVTRDSDLLLANYEHQSLIGSLGELRQLRNGCNALRAHSVRGLDQHFYRVTCYELNTADTIAQPEPSLGIVLVLHRSTGPIVPLWLSIGLGVTIALSALFLFVFLRRISSKDIPGDMEALTNWLEESLRDRGSATSAPALHFAEIRELGDKLSQMITRREQERDQAMVGQLTSGIMHDLKTPLHPIVVAHGLVSEQEPGSSKRLQRLENLFRACAANLPIMNGIMESTLDVNRQIRLERQTTDLRKTLEDSISHLQPSITNRNLDLVLDVGQKEVIVPHDPIQLGRVFSNVLKNSIEALDEARATEPGRVMGLRVCLQSINEGKVQVQIHDSGFGLKADPEKIFRVFRSTKPRGSGLGLMTSRRIVEAHGGEILAGRSEILPGARFDINLPAEASS